MMCVFQSKPLDYQEMQNYDINSYLSFGAKDKKNQLMI